jgi:hypothetical protein
VITSSNARELVDRVRRTLEGLGNFSHLHVRSNGPHIVIAAQGGADPLARLTALGNDAFGLSFPQPGGRWDMLLVDTLDDVVENVSVALAA